MNIEVCDGVSLPFFPMRPFKGRNLLKPDSIRQVSEEALNGAWVVQPKLNGDRACLACVKGKIFVQNRHGGCFRHRIRNATDFLKLPDRTCFDGEVYKGNFYPFEVIAANGVSLKLTETFERVRLAKDMVSFLGHPWLFATPSLAWLMRRSKNLPEYEGVVLKRASSFYVSLGSASQNSRTWMKRLWR